MEELKKLVNDIIEGNREIMGELCSVEDEFLLLNYTRRESINNRLYLSNHMMEFLFNKLGDQNENELFK